MSVFYNEAGQSRPRPSQPINKPSKLLSQGENEALFAIMGHSKQSMAAAVVQILGTRAPDHRSWDLLHCGVATFTKDNVRRSYYIELYDIEKGQLVFEEELYNQFVYHAEQDMFHQFEGQHQMIGINFADRTEADSFKQAIEARLMAKEKKKKERMQHNRQGLTGTQQHLQSHQGQQPISSKKKKKKKGKKGNKTPSLSKTDISTPTNFQHISHVGFDPNQDDNEVLKTFFDLVGLQEEQLSDPNTKKFILDFINENGGLEKAKEETEIYGIMLDSKPKIEHQVDGAAGFPRGPPRSSQTPSTPPTRSPAPPGHKKGTGSIKCRSQPPPLPATPSGPPPSVPPPRRIQAPPSGKAGPPPPPSGSGGPPPPPPPPPPSSAGPQPPTPSSKPTPSGNMSSPNNDFLSQISTGANILKKAEPVQRQVSSGDPRGNFLEEIKIGRALKKVDRQDSKKPEAFEPQGMAGALAAALSARKKDIHDSEDDSDGDDDSEEDDDEWDD